MDSQNLPEQAHIVFDDTGNMNNGKHRKEEYSNQNGYITYLSLANEVPTPNLTEQMMSNTNY